MRSSTPTKRGEVREFLLGLPGRSTDECILWPYSTTKAGYPKAKNPRTGRLDGAYRIAWELANDAPFPESLEARHTCGTMGCVNAAHIKPGTHLENVEDMRAHGTLRMGCRHHCWTQGKVNGRNRTRRIKRAEARARRK